MYIKRNVRKIPSKVTKKVQEKLEELAFLLEPYLLSLSSAERQDLSTIEEKPLKFLVLSHRLASEYPSLFPDFVDAEAFGEEFSKFNELSLFAKKINCLKDKINDTEMLAGNRALDFALSFYNTIKIAARREIPGTLVVYEDLKPNFPSKSKRRRKPRAEKDEGQLDLFENY